VLPQWLAGVHTAVSQDDTQATYCKKFVKEDGMIDRTADGYQNYCKFCAMDGWPGTYFFVEKTIPDGTVHPIRVKITDAYLCDKTFTIMKVVPEGKKEMKYADFLNSLTQR
jgi:methionyl-tRNA formyltransferase